MSYEEQQPNARCECCEKKKLKKAVKQHCSQSHCYTRIPGGYADFVPPEYLKIKKHKKKDMLCGTQACQHHDEDKIRYFDYCCQYRDYVVEGTEYYPDYLKQECNCWTTTKNTECMCDENDHPCSDCLPIKHKYDPSALADDLELI